MTFCGEKVYRNAYIWQSRDIKISLPETLTCWVESFIRALAVEDGDDPNLVVVDLVDDAVRPGL